MVAHLEQHGLIVSHVPGNRAYVAAVGTTTQVENAFATKLANYNVAGELKRAPVNAALLPATLGSRVSTVIGLSTGAQFAPKAVQGRRHPPDGGVAEAASARHRACQHLLRVVRRRRQHRGPGLPGLLAR